MDDMNQERLDNDDRTGYDSDTSLETPECLEYCFVSESKEEILCGKVVRGNTQEIDKGKATVPPKSMFIDMSIESICPDFEHFINTHGLFDLYQEKIQLRDVIKIRQKPANDSYGNILFSFINNLLLSNFNCRGHMLQDDIFELFKKSDNNSADDLESTQFNDMIFLESWQRDSSDCAQSTHPLDIIVAMFRFSSNMLKTVLAEQLFKCKLAIPFIYPSRNTQKTMVSLWPLRSIILETCDNFAVEALSVPCQVVSFARIGRPSTSKSALINSILYDTNHHAFLNEDSMWECKNRTISEGIVEVFWYVPSKNSTELKHVTLFMNLRGDGIKERRQLEIQASLSSVLVIKISFEDLDKEQTISILRDLFNSEARVILSIDDIKMNRKQFQDTIESYKKKIGLREDKFKLLFHVTSMEGHQKKPLTIKSEMRKFLAFLLESKTLDSIEDRVQRIKDQSFSIDEDNDIFQSTKAKAEIIVKSFHRFEKEAVLPLQSMYLKQWSKTLRKFNKVDCKTVNEIEELEKDMQNQLKRQAVSYQQHGSAMRTFIKALEESLRPEEECTTFVLWLKYLLNKQSRKVLPGFYEVCWTTWNLLRECQQKGDTLGEKNFKEKLAKCRLKIDNVSIGFENLCREIGQIYNAITSQNVNDPTVSQLPFVFAQLLIRGQPIEIMDGDSANVQLKWIEAIFKELGQILGEKRIVALSVVGVQGSGKSTVLNTMFGLQLHVSAGRCTKGVQMQIIEVNNPLLKYDYIFVFDTEGLRSPELGHYSPVHDNELATFVIGLSNISIVNMKGENMSDIQEILQIAAHAFLRIKLANENLTLNHTCIFIHHNVSAPDASRQMTTARQKFVETLDKMTKLAAEQENISDIHTFNQVINFDGEEQVFYFSDLWQGDPPMCPVNPGYSQNIANLKDKVLLLLNQDRFVTISSCFSNIKDLWEGILKDDFVFSFRNSIELKAYTLLDDEYQLQCLKLETFLPRFMQNDARVLFTAYKDNKDFHKDASHIRRRYNEELEKLVDKLETELDTFVEENELRQFMIQWKESRLQGLKEASDRIKLSYEIEISRLKEEYLMEKEMTKKVNEFKNDIHTKVYRLAMDLQVQKLSEKEQMSHFESMWTTFMNTIPVQNRDSTKKIEDTIKSIVFKTFNTEISYLQMAIKENQDVDVHCKFPHLVDSIKAEQINLAYHLSFQDKHSLQKNKIIFETLDFVNIIFIQIEEKVSKLTMNLRHEDIKDMFNVVKTSFGMEKVKKSLQFTFLPPFKAMIIIHIYRYLSEVYTRKEDTKYANQSLEHRIGNYKEAAKNIFKKFVAEINNDEMAACHFSNALVDVVTKHIKVLLPVDILEYMIKDFSCSKEKFIKRILIDLMKRDVDMNMLQYITYPYDFAIKWLTDYTELKMFNENSNVFKQLVENHCENIFYEIGKTIKSNRTECDGYKHTDEWIKKFTESLMKSKVLPLSSDDLTHVQSKLCLQESTRGINISNFQDSISRTLDETKESVLDHFNVSGEEMFDVIEIQLIPNIVQRLWGCTERCIFCHEPCKFSNINHTEDKIKHRCIQHRPQGIGGWRDINTKQLSLEFCNILVQKKAIYNTKTNIFGFSSKRSYADYKKDMPNWDIPPSNEESKYWKRVVFKYKNLIESHKDSYFERIPKSWQEITDNCVITSLSYNN